MPLERSVSSDPGNHRSMVSDRKLTGNAVITTEQRHHRGRLTLHCGRHYRAFSGEQFEGPIDLSVACASKCRCAPSLFTLRRNCSNNLRPLCLRLQILLRLQFVHLAEELLEQLAPFRADALFQLVHNFLGRKLAIKGICRIDIPPDDTREAHDALEICLRVFRAHDRKYLLAVVTPVLFKVGKKGGRQQLHRLAALEQHRAGAATERAAAPGVLRHPVGTPAVRRRQAYGELPPIFLMIDWISAAASFQARRNILAFGADVLFITVTHDTAKDQSMIFQLLNKSPRRQVQVADHS